MNFNKHFNLEGKHAFLGASKYGWVKYDENEIVASYRRFKDVERGTRLHELAARLIREGVRLEDTAGTLNQYVNDAIGFRMTPEQPLYYSPVCFGTADAISYRNGLLRIHDLKTGKGKANILQLRIYAALFCLEYDINPGDIQIELRIYQNNEIFIDQPTIEDIMPIIDKIIMFTKLLQKIMDEEGY